MTPKQQFCSELNWPTRHRIQSWSRVSSQGESPSFSIFLLIMDTHPTSHHLRGETIFLVCCCDYFLNRLGSWRPWKSLWETQKTTEMKKERKKQIIRRRRNLNSPRNTDISQQFVDAIKTEMFVWYMTVSFIQFEATLTNKNDKLLWAFGFITEGRKR